MNKIERWLYKVKMDANLMKIDTKAKEIQKENSSFFSQDEPTKIADLAREFGFFVGQATLKGGAEGLIAVNKKMKSVLNTDKNMVIVVGRNIDRSRQRFIIAHELGHYVLRDDQSASVFARRESAHGRSEEENQADYFAACILMPTKEYLSSIRELCAANNIDLKDMTDEDKYSFANILSKRYDVPQLAAFRRINEVLLSEEEKK